MTLRTLKLGILSLLATFSYMNLSAKLEAANDSSPLAESPKQPSPPSHIPPPPPNLRPPSKAPTAPPPPREQASLPGKQASEPEVSKEKEKKKSRIPNRETTGGTHLTD